MSGPNGTSAKKWYRYPSTPKSATRSAGLIWLSFVLLIFSPAMSNQPCTWIVAGGSSPADSSIAGQYTQWKRRMSFPMR